MRFTWNFFSATQLTYGPGSIGQLGQLATERGIRRAFIVSDKQLAAAGIIEKALEPLRAAQIEVHVFDGGQAEPELSIALDATSAARDFAPDAILGLGGAPAGGGSQSTPAESSDDAEAGDDNDSVVQAMDAGSDKTAG